MPKDNSTIYNIKSLVEFYDKNAKKYRTDIKSVAWGSKKSQRKRFEILSQIADLGGKSILDVGCGLGDFYEWLIQRYKTFSYTGIDITPSMVKIAKKKYPKTKFRVQNILEARNTKPAFDYVFASGIFNRKISKHKRFVEDAVKRMFKLSRKGIAFNIMSVKADFMEEKEYYANPGEILNFCLNLSRKVILRHDYMPHDFTVYVYK